MCRVFVASFYVVWWLRTVALNWRYPAIIHSVPIKFLGSANWSSILFWKSTMASVCVLYFAMIWRQSMRICPVYKKFTFWAFSIFGRRTIHSCIVVTVRFLTKCRNFLTSAVVNYNWNACLELASNVDCAAGISSIVHIWSHDLLLFVGLHRMIDKKVKI